jgi:hypothetical protein
MPERRNRPGFIVLVQIFDAASALERIFRKKVLFKKVLFKGPLRVF